MRKFIALDPQDDVKRLIRRRQLMGGDRYDEVWNGVYVMSPLADNVHQYLAGKFVTVLYQSIGANEGVLVLPGANITDREDNWKRNYRCSDVVVFLPGNTAQDRRTHYLGGPDFAVEIVSKKDRSRKKLAFYARVGVRELLLVDRYPWALELYRRQDGPFELVGRSDLSHPEVLKSVLLPLTLRLLADTPRPRVEATRPEDGQTWLI